jgi:hypothetical protein
MLDAGAGVCCAGGWWLVAGGWWYWWGLGVWSGFLGLGLGFCVCVLLLLLLLLLALLLLLRAARCALHSRPVVQVARCALRVAPLACGLALAALAVAAAGWGLGWGVGAGASSLIPTPVPLMSPSPIPIPDLCSRCPLGTPRSCKFPARNLLVAGVAGGGGGGALASCLPPPPPMRARIGVQRAERRCLLRAAPVSSSVCLFCFASVCLHSLLDLFDAQPPGSSLLSSQPSANQRFNAPTRL